MTNGPVEQESPDMPHAMPVATRGGWSGVVGAFLIAGYHGDRVRPDEPNASPVTSRPEVMRGQYAGWRSIVFTNLIHEPASIVTLAVIVVLSIGLDYGWKRPRHPAEKCPARALVAYDEHDAKPYRWAYDGTPLEAA
jgi:hypothetical protein